MHWKENLSPVFEDRCQWRQCSQPTQQKGHTRTRAGTKGSLLHRATPSTSANPPSPVQRRSLT